MHYFLTNSRIVIFVVIGLMIALSFEAYASGRRLREKNRESATLNDSTKIGGGQEAGDFRRALSFGGDNRFYEMHVPASYKPGTPTPLVLMFHGGGGNPNAARTTTGLDAVSDREGFIVVYPGGTGKTEDATRLTWNILISDTPATQNKKDDIGFVKVVLKDVLSRLSIDANRIYATGISQGGMMCYRIACDSELSSRIAAIAPVSGVMTVSPDDCHASRAVPIMHFHGTADKVVPYDGSQGGRFDPVVRPSVAATINYWIAHNKLSKEPRDSGSRGKAEFKDYGQEGAPGEIVLWSLEEGGHTWPGGDGGLPEFLVGKVNRDISASELIWKFFQRHPLK